MSACISPLDWGEFPSQFHELLTIDTRILRNLEPSLQDLKVKQIQKEFTYNFAWSMFNLISKSVYQDHWILLTKAPARFQDFMNDLVATYNLPASEVDPVSIMTETNNSFL
jgi:hypothetical protein